MSYFVLVHYISFGFNSTVSCCEKVVLNMVALYMFHEFFVSLSLLSVLVLLLPSWPPLPAIILLDNKIAMFYYN